ncbi:MAG: hypothetical protein FJW96_07590, partial [Actinobacteria bacterium]|nr:hypothetical protein [Actinomycetota bacterium]
MPRLPGWAWVIVIVALSAAARVFAARGVSAAWIAPDEPYYGLVGRSLFGGDTVLDGVPGTSLVTPLVLGLPTLVFDDVASVVSAAQVIHAVLMSTVVAVAFAWARPLAGERWAYAAGALAALAPGMAYAGLM